MTSPYQPITLASARESLMSAYQLPNRDRTVRNLTKSKEKRHNFQPALTSRQNFNSALPSSRKQNQDICPQAQPTSILNTSRSNLEIVERKVVKQTVLKNAEGEENTATLYQLKRASDAIKSLDIHMFMELERIKRPSPAILHIAKLACVFFEIFRERD